MPAMAVPAMTVPVFKSLGGAAGIRELRASVRADNSSLARRAPDPAPTLTRAAVAPAPAGDMGRRDSGGVGGGGRRERRSSREKSRERSSGRIGADGGGVRGGGSGSVGREDETRGAGRRSGDVASDASRAGERRHSSGKPKVRVGVREEVEVGLGVGVGVGGAYSFVACHIVI